MKNCMKVCIFFLSFTCITALTACNSSEENNDSSATNKKNENISPKIEQDSKSNNQDSIKSASVKVNGNDKIYVYKVSNQFELKFIIPKSTGKVNHISVFSPEDSINKMAG
ncbi:DUF4309 domain-containing protein [Bacillus clarus]|uniref:DUF4309 domain-containing protein n=1 Tax=Bacillus clarus TaxID=2338372 RepID=A0A090Z2Q2_9BACI|nr:DUF4309 domain-containing protein [Bacillus clarus]KFM98690.1 hypothetical protein DJ93_5283 [Bacillus clarus]RFT63278.1 DUF4309 domain-containing protein [Bacillus clarus]